jgi:hypothetical protein
MKKPISRQMHAVTDYAYAAFIAAAPELIGYETNETAAGLSRAVGGEVALASLLTRYELGLVPAMSFKTHLMGDVAVGLLTIAAPWLFGFADDARARNTFLGFGAFSVMAGLLTQPDEMRENPQ